MKIFGKRKKTNPVRIGVFCFFAIYSLLMILLLFWAIIASLGEHVELLTSNRLFPSKLHFENYANAFVLLGVGKLSYFGMLWNSIWLSVGKSTISIAVTACAGYALAHYRFVGRNFMCALIVVIAMIPSYGTEAANMVLMHDLGLYDSPALLLTCVQAHGSGTLVIMTLFQSMSSAYDEAARIDGANKMRIFLGIYMSMALPTLFALWISNFIGNWNDPLTTIYYLPSYNNIPAGLYVYETVSKHNMDTPLYYAGVLMCAIPPIILFSVFSDKLMTSVTIGGIK